MSALGGYSDGGVEHAGEITKFQGVGHGDDGAVDGGVAADVHDAAEHQPGDGAASGAVTDIDVVVGGKDGYLLHNSIVKGCVAGKVEGVLFPVFGAEFGRHAGDDRAVKCAVIKADIVGADTGGGANIEDAFKDSVFEKTVT